MTDLVERLVPDELWVLFRRVVPPTEVKRPQGGGRRRAGDREALAAIIFVATSGCTWRQLPPVFGPAWPMVYRRFAQWSRERVWARLHRVALDKLGAPGELDWSRCAIDSVSVRAAEGAFDGTESDRSRQAGIEDPLITDRNGLPLSLGISGANMHDTELE
ncbi:IS5 family transposase [Streptomyces werraensis]|uniref:IS5 family transposase n=1 Tax=Streptomyces werraensis TaxID=68284 RepID=UPI00341A833C|nr:IS5 family transposase [Streptomyces werraensis]